MEKNCSACGSKHTAPFGRYCKSGTMAVIEGYDRDSDEYLKFLEDEFCRHQKFDERESKTGITASASASAGAEISGFSRVLDANRQAMEAIANRLERLELAATKDKDPGATISAANLIAAPLTKALSKLTDGEEEEGKYLRPEYYAQSDIKEKGRDHNKLDAVGLFYGWTCVAKHIVSYGGDIKSYLDHLKYAAGMLHTRQFYDIGAVKYNRMIVDKYLENKSSMQYKWRTIIHISKARRGTSDIFVL